MLLIPLDYF